MRTRTISCVALLCAGLALVGCGNGGDDGGGDDDSSGPELLPGFAPPAPGAGEIQIVGPIVEAIQPGDDITLCHYIDFDVDADYDITDYQGFQSTFGHHVLLYQVQNRQPAGTHPCTEEDMANSRYLAGGGSESGKPEIPPGIVMRVKKGSQLLIQTHWINTSDAVQRGQGAFNVKWSPSSPSNVVADLFTVYTSQIDIMPGSTGSASAECVMQQQMSFFSFGGHEHYLGTHVSVTYTPAGGSPTMIYDTDWSPHYESDPPRTAFTKEEPFVVQVGDTIRIDCDYYNSTGARVRFPQEMCVFFAYYFPATRQIDCGDGFWPGDGS